MGGICGTHPVVPRYKYHARGRYATSQNDAGSIPDEVIGFFSIYLILPAALALGSTQPLTEMSTRNLPGGKGRARKADNFDVS
jgi:hypothetical protein